MIKPSGWRSKHYFYYIIVRSPWCADFLLKAACSHLCCLFLTHVKQMYSGCFILEAKDAYFQAVYNTVQRN